MKQLWKQILAAALCLLMAAAVFACKKTDDTVLQIAALKGPTGLGLAMLAENTEDTFEISVYDAPDVVRGKFISGEVDIAAVPVNLASVLYHKTEGEAVMIAVNTLGVLYILENGDSVQSLSDLAGKTLYATGQGSTPEYVLNRLLAVNGLSDGVTVEYVGEHAALAGMVASGEAELAMLPEPNVSAVLLKNDSVRIALDLTKEWESAFDTTLVQGCYIVRKSVLEAHPQAVKAFVEAAAASTEYMLSAEDAPAVAAAQGIVPSEGVAKKAIPHCNLVCITGEEMQRIAGEMLSALFEANPKSIGGALPGDAFYAKLD